MLPSNKIILHIDGDAFFASCEIAQNEALRGKPVVTGQEKGMAIALSYAAKERGISRGMLIRDVRKLCPEAIILPGNYDLYKIYCHRMYAIVRRYAPVVEEYSVDECFADLSSSTFPQATDIAKKIKKDLEQDLGMSFSIGLAPTKTLAKVASKWVKPSGFTVIKQEEIQKFLEKIPISAVWGIGRSMSVEFQKEGIKNALEFTLHNKSWVEEHYSKPYQELWYELNGTSIHSVKEGSREKHQSIRATRTFHPISKDTSVLLSELSKNAEKACLKLRKNNLQSKTIYFFLKTQTFRYSGKEIIFDYPVSTPSEIMNEIEKIFPSLYKKGVEYRATGIVLHGIIPDHVHQSNLFNMNAETDKRSELYITVDTIFNKFGRNSIFITSSLRSRIKNILQTRKRSSLDIFYDTALRLGIPSWGEAH